MSFLLPEKLINLQEKLLNLRQKGELFLQNGDLGFASAPSNIALIKYWGKKQGVSQIPENPSLSFTLGGFRSFTQIEVLGRFFPENEMASVKDCQYLLALNDGDTYATAPQKTFKLLKNITSGWAPDIGFKIKSSNNFPTACGIASSASGMAALVGAIADLLQLEKHFSDADLNYWLAEWARLGSGSATRSTLRLTSPHFCGWLPKLILGSDNYETFTSEVEVDANLQNNFKHCVVVVDASPKKISSGDGHFVAPTSILNKLRLAQAHQLFLSAVTALKQGDFNALKDLSERDAFNMHAVMLTSSPSLCYVTEKTIDIITAFVAWRDKNSIAAFWTLDAGANIHICFLESARRALHEFFSCAYVDIKILQGLSMHGLVIGKKNYYDMQTQPLIKFGLN